jgi:beta-lactamase regulating signal transducer with metallopeptidase domain
MTISDSFSILGQAFGFAVLHSLWQIALIWLIFKALSSAFRGKNQLIYLLSLAGMLVALLWFSHTFAGKYAAITASLEKAAVEPGFSAAFAPNAINQSMEMEGIAKPDLFLKITTWLESHAAQVGWAWGFCVLLLWLRLLGGWWLVQRLRSKDVEEPANAVLEQCRLLAGKLKINAVVRLLESPHVSEPLTLGFWKPVILFPAGMLLSLSPAQVEALLLHELAHIRRYDYLINLFQLAFETCFFYHPMFWLISRDARVQREFCCDDVVLYHTSDPILYAKTLTDLQISFLHPTTQFTMNATGKSRFTERILRIAGLSPKREGRPSLLIITLLPAIIAFGSIWHTQASNTIPENNPIDDRIAVADSIPPKKAGQPATNVARPKQEVLAAEPAEKASPVQPVREISKPKIAVEVVKMNVFYIGVDNPLRVAVDGVPSNELVLRIDNGGIITGADGSYNVVVTKPGGTTITVLRKVGDTEELISTQQYRVKRVPDPVPRLNDNTKGGAISKEALLERKGIIALLENFDFDAGCKVVSYELTVIPQGQNPISMHNSGSEFTSNARELLSRLAGLQDAVFFDDIKIQCPGDGALRNIGGLAFKVLPRAAGN